MIMPQLKSASHLTEVAANGNRRSSSFKCPLESILPLNGAAFAAVPTGIDHNTKGAILQLCVTSEAVHE